MIKAAPKNIPDCFRCGSPQGGNYGFREKYGVRMWHLCNRCRGDLIESSAKKGVSETELLLQFERTIK